MSLKKASTIGREIDAEDEHMRKFVDSVIAKGSPWTDPDFRPERSSLYDPQHDDVNTSEYGRLTWQRCTDIFPFEKTDVFVDKVEISDVIQGGLGDCYFLAVLSAMAETPGAIESHFYTKKKNAAGIYMIYFYVNGKKTGVVIDDYIPCRGGRPFATSTKTNELWAILLEKAWAKLHGTYARIEAGLPSFACMHLLGTPAESLWHGDFEDESAKDAFWKKLQRCDAMSYMMMAASHGQGEEKTASGVISGHAYSFIGVRELTHKGQNVRLCQLRNPWGSGEWTGAWSDNDDVWTD